MEPPVSHPFAWTAEPFGPVLRSQQLADVASHFFTTRIATEPHVELRLRGTGATAQWGAVAMAIGVAPGRLARLKQVHGTDIVIIRRAEPPETEHAAGRSAFRLTATGHRVPLHSDDGLPRADVLMTDDPDTAIAVQTADCVPVLIADEQGRAVAAVHAGWRGTAARAVAHAVSAFASQFASRPEHLVAAIGPSIGRCCYQVGSDVVEAFRAAGFEDGEIGRWFTAEADGGRLRLDVASANRDQLVAAGLRPGSIAESRLCTACHPSFFHSYRRDGTTTGRLAAVIRPVNSSRYASSQSE